MEISSMPVTTGLWLPFVTLRDQFVRDGMTPAQAREEALRRVEAQATEPASAAASKRQQETDEAEKVFRALSGADRHALYLTAAATAFHVSELASMTPESFNLDADAPTATVQASCTKNRKLAVQPLPMDVAAAL